MESSTEQIVRYNTEQIVKGVSTEQISFNLDTDFIVVQHNNLIMANYNMTALEQKLFLILLSTIKKEDTEVTKRIFRVADLAKLMNVTQHSLYKDLKRTCKTLMTKTIEVQKPDGDWDMINIIPTSKYHNAQGTISLKVNKDAYPYLLQLKKMFTHFKLENILELDSKYAIRIYQQAKSNLNRKTYIISLNDFKRSLCLTQKAYNSFSNINLKVLTPSIKEINNKTDIKISIEQIKVGRKVDSLKFNVYPNKITNVRYNNEHEDFMKSNKDIIAPEYDYKKLEQGLLGYEDIDIRDAIKKK